MRRLRILQLLVGAAQRHLRAVDTVLAEHGFMNILLVRPVWRCVLCRDWTLTSFVAGIGARYSTRQDAFFQFPSNNILHALVSSLLGFLLKENTTSPLTLQVRAQDPQVCIVLRVCVLVDSDTCRCLRCP